MWIRARVLIAAVVVQMALGTVYAWSVFNVPLQQHFGWTKSQAVAPFTVAIAMICVGAIAGGRIQDRTGPRAVALIGGVVYAFGVIASAWVDAPSKWWWLVASYGVLGGIGLGAVYITPIAMLVAWFPRHRGLVTGLAVGGFGFGAVLAAPAARSLLSTAAVPTSVFLWMGIPIFALVTLGALAFRKAPTTTADDEENSADQSYTLAKALRSGKWYALAAILFLNVSCGIALISQLSDAAQQIARLSPPAAASLVGILGLFNGGGRVLWAWVSDRIGRMPTCALLLLIQGAGLIAMPWCTSPAMFVTVAAAIYLCYGGGFGVMPAATADAFGTRFAGSIYGTMIIGWSLGGIVGPLLISAGYQWTGGSYAGPMVAMGVLGIAASVLPMTLALSARRTRTGRPASPLPA